MVKNRHQVRNIRNIIGVLTTLILLLIPQARYAATTLVNYCDESVETLTPWSSQSISLGNDWELTADKIGWCSKKDDPDVDNIVVARGGIKIQMKGQHPILSVDLSDLHIDELMQAAVTVERDKNNNVLVVAPNYSGLGMQLSASNIIKYAGSKKGTEITLISDFPWRFYPDETTSNLILYPAFFRPVLTGISDGTFGWTGSFVDALEQKFEEGSLNLSIPFTVTQDTVSTIAGHEPTILFNIGTWFGKVFGLPLESVPILLSQKAGESHARVKFDVTDVLGSIPQELLGVFTHAATIKQTFLKYNSKDKLKLETKKAIVWGDDKLLKYSKSKLSYLPDEHKTKFLKDIDDSKTHASTGTDDLLKALGRLMAVVDNTETDYDFINQDIALNPLFVQIGLFKEIGDFQGSIYAGLSKRGDPAWYFLDKLGLDVTMPYELTQVSAVPFFALERIPLPENPFQVGLGVVELGGTISGMADPLYDVFQLAGKGGEAVDYSKWKVDAETEGTVALVDSLSLIMGTQEVGLPWPLTLKTTLDFKLGNQNGIAGTGTLSLFDFIEGKGSFHFFIGNNAKPIDFQAGLDASVLGAHATGTLNSYFDRDKNFWMTLNTQITDDIFGHKLTGLPLNIELFMNQEEIKLTAGISWGSHFCGWGHCLIHGGNKSQTRDFNFNTRYGTGAEIETTYGDSIYSNAVSDIDHAFTVDSGNERLTISAQCIPGAYPEFNVSGPAGAFYYMKQNESDSGAVVIDVNNDDFEIHPISDDAPFTVVDRGFIVDAVAGTTRFVLQDPQPGQYTVTLATAPEYCSQVAAHVTARMVTLSAADTQQQTIDINEANSENFTVAMRSANTIADSKVAVYARPSTFRNSTYDYWHEKLFNAFSDPSMREQFSDKGDFIYRTDFSSDSTVKSLGYLDATHHDVDNVIVPQTDLIQINPPLTLEAATTRQRNHASVKLGEFLIDQDGVHQLELLIGAHEVYGGKYQLLAKYENREDSQYVELPYILTVHNDTLLAAPSITSVEETEDGEALIHWSSSVDSADIAMVRVFLHDHANGSSAEVYHTYFDFNATAAIKIPGLREGDNYSFSIALLKEVSNTDESGKTSTLQLPGLRSATAAFTPQGDASVGSPCVKLVDSESYASFNANGDLFMRLRILNESQTAMTDAPVRIYYNHRNEENLLAEFQATQDGLSYSDVHLTIPFEHLNALKESDSDNTSIVYDIETDDQNEFLLYDNAGIMEIENKANFLAAKASLQGTPILLRLKQGWNLAGDAIEEEGIFENLSNADIYSHDGTKMQANVPNVARGGGYFVYLSKDKNIILTGTPIVPDFDNLDENKWQLMGTGVDIYSTLSGNENSSKPYTYTPGEKCESIYVMQRLHDGETQWQINPDIIEAGSGFWCVKEQ